MLELPHQIVRAFRRLVRRPIDSALVVGTLSLGIGATVGIFLLSDGVLRRSLPVQEPEGLVYVVSQRLDSGGFFPVRWHEAASWRESIRGFESLTVFRRGTAHLRDAEDPLRVGVAEIDSAYFSVLGAEPALGRGLTPRQIAEQATVAVISHGLWQRRFGGKPEIIGQTIDLDGALYTITGVMPQASEHRVLGWMDVWVPLRVDPVKAMAETIWGFSVLARLRPEADLDAVRGELATASARLAQEQPAWNEGWGGHLEPVREWMALDAAEPLRILRWAAALVLLVACVTASNLLVGMVANRERELLIRRSLGARRGHLLAQLGLECVLLATAAGSLGLVVAAGVGQIAARELPTSILRLETLPLGIRGLAMAAGVAAGAAAFCCLLSGLALRRADSFRRARGATASARIRSGLIVTETTLATLALIGAVLLVRSLEQVRQVDPGFEETGLLTLRLELPSDAFPEKGSRISAYRHLLDEVESLPGVESAAMAGMAFPMTGGAGAFQLWVEGRPRGPQPDVVVDAQVVSPGYFETLEISSRSGTGFERAETWESHQRVLVNRTFAHRYWPDEEAAGRWIEWGNGERGTVIGVVGDVHQADLEAPPRPEVYLAWGTAPRTQTLVVRATTDLGTLTETLRKMVAKTLPGTPVYDVRTGREIVQSSFAAREVSTWALTAFAGLAQILGLIGLYGVVTHSVRSRRRDLAIRTSIGARPRDLMSLVFRNGLTPVALGLMLGVAGALAAGRALESQLYGVSPSDPLAFLAATGVVVLTASIATLAPARLAAAVDPAEILRDSA